jgi:hypothetical protein
MRNNENHKYLVKHKNGSYQVQIWHNSKHNYIGLYPTIEEAIIARDIFLKKNSHMNTSSTYESRYVDNREMMREVIISKEMGILSDKLLNQCMKIVKGISKKFRYKDEEDRFDCECYAIEIIIKNWYHFDELRYDNPFPYYTEIIKRGFAFQFKILQKNKQSTISLDYTFDNGKSIQNYI